MINFGKTAREFAMTRGQKSISSGRRHNRLVPVVRRETKLDAGSGGLEKTSRRNAEGIWKYANTTMNRV